MAPEAVCRQHTPFAVLSRAFFAQFFSSEAVASDLRLRQAIIGVLAFLVTPGMLLAIEMYPRYQMALRFAPQTADRIFLLLVSVFITYSGVTIGVIAVFVWESLSFDRRDAMILGPLPLDGRTIVCAKLAALGAFLLGATVTTNLLSAVPFAMVIADYAGAAAALRTVVAHMVATVSAAVFVFSALVTLRGALGVLGVRISAIGATILQFAFVAGLLSFVVIVLRSVRGSAGPTIVNWVPTFWFAALFERVLGPVRPGFDGLWPRAVWATAALLACAVLVSLAGYRREMRRALVPTPRLEREPWPVRIAQTLVKVCGLRDPVSRATAHFIMVTMVHGRSQQMLVAINAAIAAPVLAASFSSPGTTVESWMQPRTMVLWIPLVVVYWVAIGFRASTFLPHELAARWTFEINGPDRSSAYRNATRASLLCLLVPIGVVVTLGTAPLIGPRLALYHLTLVVLLTVGLAEVIVWSMAHVPFTCAYPAGHARLKTRWPLYACGFLIFAYAPARIEVATLADTSHLNGLLGLVAIALAVLMWLSRRFATPWPSSAGEDSGDDAGAPAVLNLGQAVRSTERAYQMPPSRARSRPDVDGSHT